MFDEDGIREVEATAASDMKRRERERSRREALREYQDSLRHAFASGNMTMVDYAKQAREAGIAASEVAAALKERQAADRRLALQHDSAAQDAAAGEAIGRPSELTAAMSAKMKGLEQMRRGSNDDAIDAFTTAAALAESLTSDSSQTCHAPDLADEARKLYKACLLNAALCCIKVQRWPEVEQACSKILELDADCAKALYRRGKARIALDRAAEAIEDLTSASRLLPKDVEVRQLLKEARSRVTMTLSSSADAIGAPWNQVEPFVPASAGFQGFRGGYVFKMDTRGLGYYKDDLAPTCRPATLELGPSNTLKQCKPDLSVRSYYYLDISIDGSEAGSLTVQLFDDIVPTTVIPHSV